MGTVLVTGNTYPVKDAIKALGGRWDAAAKGWRVAADKAAEAQALVAGKPSAPATQGSGSATTCKCGRPKKAEYSTCYSCSSASKKCQTCGHVERRNARGYVEGDWVRGGECQSCREERRMGY